MTTTIDVRSLRKAYGGRAVVDGVDLRVEPGRIIGFVGPNGAGKTTCLRCLVGLIQADAGHVRVLGLDPASDSLRVRRLASYLPGETSVYRQMTAREFLRLALKFYPRVHDDLIERMTALFELPMHRPVRAFSAGMKQKLALMAALGPRVPLYILDEPDRALDASVRLILRELLVELRNRGASTLLSSHHLAEVEAVCDETVFIVGGQTIHPRRVDEVRHKLRRRLVLTLWPGKQIDLPTGFGKVQLPDGRIAVTATASEADPLQLLAQLPPDAIESAEVGATRLEAIYQELTA